MNFCIRVAALVLSAGLAVAAEQGARAGGERAMQAPVDWPDHQIGFRYWNDKESATAVVVARAQPLPAYPVELLGAVVDGFAKLEFVVGNDGNVRDVRADTDSDPAFVPAAMAAVQKWSFQPPVDRKTAAPVTARMNAQFVFKRFREDDGVPGQMGPFAHTRLTGREVVELAAQEVRKQGIDLAEYPDTTPPDQNSLYPYIWVQHGRDGRIKWLLRWGQRTDDTHGKELLVWIDDQSRLAHVKEAPKEWKAMPDSDDAVTVRFRRGQGSPGAIAAVAIPLPAYPPEMARAGMTGRVEVALTLQRDGTVADAKLIKSTLREFEAPVAEAIKQWQFRPSAGGGANAGNMTVTADIIFRHAPDDYYDSALHGRAFVLARLSGHAVFRLASATVQEQGGEIPPDAQPNAMIYGTKLGYTATQDGAVQWLFDELLPDKYIWIYDASGVVRVEQKSAYKFVAWRDIPEEIRAIATGAVLAHGFALAEFNEPETKFDTVKSKWIFGYHRRGKTIPWVPEFTVAVDAKTHGAEFRVGR